MSNGICKRWPHCGCWFWCGSIQKDTLNAVVQCPCCKGHIVTEKFPVRCPYCHWTVR